MMILKKKIASMELVKLILGLFKLKMGFIQSGKIPNRVSKMIALIIFS